VSHPNRSDTTLPGEDALIEVCRSFGVESIDARLLHHRSNAVYLVPRSNIVVRLAPDTELRRERARASIEVSRWLEHQPGRIALAPLPGEQPVIVAGAVATLWPYRPADDVPTLADVARLLKRLHELPAPPFALPEYRPLHRLREAVALDAARDAPVLTPDDRAWLVGRADVLVHTFATTTFPLGLGLVHGDAHAENLALDNGEWVLIDWDGCCVGPRELDLIGGLPTHFHEPETDRQQFFQAYGYDLMDWPGWTMLRDIAELHSLASYVRLAPSKPTAAEQLATRMRSLRTGDRSVRWEAVS
jgi:Ser/Thr protein kinase RdoA (MazF antagonist)